MDKARRAEVALLARRLTTAMRAKRSAGLALTGPADLYMVRVGHPALRELYESWMRGAGIRYGPPGDEARLRFELGLLNRDALQAVRAAVEKMEQSEKK